MAEVILMPEIQTPVGWEWLDGSYPPIPQDSLSRVVIEFGFQRYCWTQLPVSISLQELRDHLSPISDFHLDDPSTRVFIQTRQWIAGPYFNEWDRVWQDGHFTMWETTKILKERT